MLVVQHCDDCEKHHEQRRERQRGLEGLAQPLLFGDAGQRGGQHDHQQADDADLGDVQAQRDDQDDRGQRLRDQRRDFARRALATLLAIVLGEHLPHVGRQARAVAEPAQLFDEHARHQPYRQHGQRHRRHPCEKFDERPVRVLRDQQVLRLAHLRHDAAERSTDCGVHHQPAQERAKCIEIGAVQLLHFLVAADVVLDVVLLAGSEAMEHLVEAGAHRDQHRDDRERIEKGRERRRGQAEDQGQRESRADAEQDLREHEQQQLAQEVDARDHEHEQQDDRHGSQRFVVDRSRRRQSDQHALDRQQAAGLQRVAPQRHRQREDELEQQQPARDDRAVLAAEEHDQRIDDQERDDRQLVPVRRVAEEVAGEGLRERARHMPAQRFRCCFPWCPPLCAATPSCRR